METCCRAERLNPGRDHAKLAVDSDQRGVEEEGGGVGLVCGTAPPVPTPDVTNVQREGRGSQIERERGRDKEERKGREIVFENGKERKEGMEGGREGG